jgi:tRNA(Ile)-lysidine synthase
MLAVASRCRDDLASRGIELHVATVDHGLRTASAEEALGVARAVRSLGLSHRTLSWQGPKPSSNLQGAARAARYDLLEAHARAIGASAILTAHHQDDQIETHALARLRHAGDRGLACMRSRRGLGPGVSLVRPFLDLPGRRLRAALVAGHLPVFEDPSNRDDRFLRIRLRHELADLGGEERRDILAAIARHQRLRDVADRAIAAVLGEAATVDPFGTVRLRAASLAGLASALHADLFGRVLAAVAGAEHAPVRGSVERLLEKVAGPQGTATLGGVSFQHGSNLTFSREFGRVGPGAVTFETPGSTVVFDRRFIVSLREGADMPSLASGTRLIALGALGRGNAVERTIPVLVAGNGRVEAVPPALARKAPAVGRLQLVSRVAWRLLADLPSVGAFESAS